MKQKVEIDLEVALRILPILVHSGYTQTSTGDAIYTHIRDAIVNSTCMYDINEAIAIIWSQDKRNEKEDS